MKRIALITAIAAAFTLSGCETMHGIGNDISDGWHSMTGSDSSSDTSSMPAHTDSDGKMANGNVHDTNGGGNP
ncbi:MAG TPA: hypothetical protein VL625_03900 [Patescibacteria group bacterium]|jgi:predicted small secreted protein|nr:hypothetical protein [Patescibacteria group bacterium]